MEQMLCMRNVNRYGLVPFEKYVLLQDIHLTSLFARLKIIRMKTVSYPVEKWRGELQSLQLTPLCPPVGLLYCPGAGSAGLSHKENLIKFLHFLHNALLLVIIITS